MSAATMGAHPLLRQAYDTARKDLSLDESRALRELLELMPTSDSGTNAPPPDIAGLLLAVVRLWAVWSEYGMTYDEVIKRFGEKVDSMRRY